MAVSLQTGSDSTTVEITGTATVSSVAEMATMLIEAFATRLPVIVDITELERADMSLVQVLVATARTARDSGTAYSIKGDLGPLMDAVGQSPDLSDLLNT